MGTTAGNYWYRKQLKSKRIAATGDDMEISTYRNTK
jgi:hypothetical protein